MEHPTNIHNLMKSTGPIWVRNISRREKKMDMKVHLEFKDPTGKTQVVHIPSMKYPIDLAARVAPRKMIANNSHFLRLLSLHILEIVPNDEAQKMLSQPGAVDIVEREMRKGEVQRSIASPNPRERFNLRVRGERPGDESLPETEGLGHDEVGDRDLAIPPDFADLVDGPEFGVVRDQGAVMLAQKDGISPRVAQLMARLLEDSGYKTEAIQDLQMIDDETITDTELAYIIDKARNFPQIASWARQMLASRQPASQPRRRKRRKKS